MLLRANINKYTNAISKNTYNKAIHTIDHTGALFAALVKDLLYGKESGPICNLLTTKKKEP
jgi:hypothetical protein